MQPQTDEAAKKLGRQIAQTRKSLGLTQTELGLRMGLTPGSAKARIASIEAGINLTLDTMVAIGNAFGMVTVVEWRKQEVPA